jgi:hypothetical protein
VEGKWYTVVRIPLDNIGSEVEQLSPLRIDLKVGNNSWRPVHPTTARLELGTDNRASDTISGLAEGKHVFYCDVNLVFLNPDGSINHEMMPDWLHPSPAGAKAWVQAMEPLLSKLMGDKSL